MGLFLHQQSAGFEWFLILPMAEARGLYALIGKSFNTFSFMHGTAGEFLFFCRAEPFP